MNFNLIVTKFNAFAFASLDYNEIFFTVKAENKESLLYDNNLHEIFKSELDFIRYKVYMEYLFASSATHTRIYLKKDDDYKLIKEELISNIVINHDRIFHLENLDNKFYINCYNLKTLVHEKKLEIAQSCMLIKINKENLFLVNQNKKIVQFIDYSGILSTYDLSTHVNQEGFPQLELLTTYNNQLICVVNQNKIIGINMDNGAVEWEVDTVYDVDGSIKVISDLPMFNARINNKIIFCSGILYKELDLESKVVSIKKYFGDLNDISSSEIFIQQISLYNNLIYFTSKNLKTKRWHTVGIFNPTTLSVEWTRELDLPQTIFLNNAPLVDEKYLYITDSASTLYVFEKEKV